MLERAFAGTPHVPHYNYVLLLVSGPLVYSAELTREQQPGAEFQLLNWNLQLPNLSQRDAKRGPFQRILTSHEQLPIGARVRNDGKRNIISIKGRGNSC